jgi:hypothetical protein
MHSGFTGVSAIAMGGGTTGFIIAGIEIILAALERKARPVPDETVDRR